MDSVPEISIAPKQCAWCNRWYNAQGKYTPAPFIAINVSHGICPKCFQTEKTKIERMRDDLVNPAQCAA